MAFLHTRLTSIQLSRLIMVSAVVLYTVPAHSQQNTVPAVGFVGFGTTSPTEQVEISTVQTLGHLQLKLNAAADRYGSLAFYENSVLRWNIYNDFANDNLTYGNSTGPKIAVSQSGNLGIGTSNPTSKLHVVGDALITGDTEISSLQTLGHLQLKLNAATDRYGSLIFYENSVLRWNIYNDFANDNLTYGNSTGPKIAVSQSGSLGIGTIDPTSKLHVVGDAFITGDIKVSGKLAAKYQDIAEWVPAKVQMDPGTVVVLNPEKANEVMPATVAYDTTVAGVVSAMPGLILGEAGDTKAQIATTGRVKVKASAAGNPIRIGDLLVTSDKSGFAIKSEPMKVGGCTLHQPGTIIGKALEPLHDGEGQILVLLSLQ